MPAPVTPLCSVFHSSSLKSVFVAISAPSSRLRREVSQRLPLPQARRSGKNPPVGLEPVRGAARVSLLRWLRRQLRQPEPLREHLEAAIGNDDAAEARRIVERFDFSAAQRRHVERLLDEWERDLRQADGGRPGCPRRAPKRTARPRRPRRPSRRSAAPARPRCWRRPPRAPRRGRARASSPRSSAARRSSTAEPSAYPFPTPSSLGPVAQLVEQGTFNPKVAGSIPARPITTRSTSQPPRSRVHTRAARGTAGARQPNGPTDDVSRPARDEPASAASPP